jgi:hypothetical protein
MMPPKGERLSKDQVALLTKWIEEGANWPEIKADHLTLTQPADDLTFLRRVTLDTIGVVPSLEEIAAFQKNPDRAAVIDKLLADPRWADHWMGYWQDVLAENPNILNPTLNNTGPSAGGSTSRCGTTSRWISSSPNCCARKAASVSADRPALAPPRRTTCPWPRRAPSSAPPSSAWK